MGRNSYDPVKHHGREDQSLIGGWLTRPETLLTPSPVQKANGTSILPPRQNDIVALVKKREALIGR